MTEELCHCGKPLHYSNPRTQLAVQSMIDSLGPYVRIRVMDRAWMVQRHYLALHGINAAELPSLGFQEVPQTKTSAGD